MVMEVPADTFAAPDRAALDRVREAAVRRERARMARELHDVVTHHISLIAVQAAAALVEDGLPDGVRRTLESVHRTAREALTETRLVVGRLRAEDEAGIDRLDDLVGAARRGGLPVSMLVVGTPRRLSRRASLAAYRIVQEALGNTARYAPGARVVVEVRYGADVLTVSVADEGAAGAPNTPGGGGNGLVGMVERVTALGGAIEAGPRDGGWSVVVHLPYDPV
ncbi:sensor histidine kinase [Actinomadura sediminis]|uniref:histidine kinase n=1 Tax=Actinomadura sediminis TaxID=1038904 RepID=A0ABW3ENU4_9ACTN